MKLKLFAVLAAIAALAILSGCALTPPDSEYDAWPLKPWPVASSTAPAAAGG